MGYMCTDISYGGLGMIDTKERILITALKLFARDGYEAVSVRTISEELGMTKGALYRHYKNKRDIFDSIVNRMIEIDAQRAKENKMPADKFETAPDTYRNTSIESIKIYTIEQFRFWTEDEFASQFRKMLTLEQFHNAEMATLYSQCISAGPVLYMADVFRELIGKGILKDQNPKQLAIEYYAPMFLLINMFDTAEENVDYVGILISHINIFFQHYATD